MLEGESGVGKTRLAVEVLQQAAAHGATVISDEIMMASG